MSLNHITGVFHDESLLLAAMKKLKSERIKITNLYGPCVDHQVLRELTPESRFSYLSLLVGIITIIGTFAAVYYITVIDYPMIFGGKPVFSFPPMVIVIFLVTILVTGGVSTLSFLGLVRLYPGKPGKTQYSRSLDDRYYLVVPASNKGGAIKQWLLESGAEEIMEENS